MRPVSLILNCCLAGLAGFALSRLPDATADDPDPLAPLLPPADLLVEGCELRLSTTAAQAPLLQLAGTGTNSLNRLLQQQAGGQASPTTQAAPVAPQAAIDLAIRNPSVEGHQIRFGLLAWEEIPGSAFSRMVMPPTLQHCQTVEVTVPPFSEQVVSVTLSEGLPAGYRYQLVSEASLAQHAAELAQVRQATHGGAPSPIWVPNQVFPRGWQTVALSGTNIAALTQD